MKSNLRTIALAALVAVASSAPALHAQDSLIYARVNVPFSFDYGTTHFAHGTYILSMNRDNTVLTVRNNASSARVIAQLGFDPTPVKTSHVTFRKYGDRYFLEEIAIAGSDSRVSVRESKAEKNAARELASRGADATQVALALLPGRTLGN
jgi:hypothetical protein